MLCRGEGKLVPDCAVHKACENVNNETPISGWSVGRRPLPTGTLPCSSPAVFANHAWWWLVCFVLFSLFSFEVKFPLGKRAGRERLGEMLGCSGELHPAARCPRVPLGGLGSVRSLSGWSVAQTGGMDWADVYRNGWVFLWVSLSRIFHSVCPGPFFLSVHPSSAWGSEVLQNLLSSSSYLSDAACRGHMLEGGVATQLREPPETNSN